MWLMNLGICILESEKQPIFKQSNKKSKKDMKN